MNIYNLINYLFLFYKMNAEKRIKINKTSSCSIINLKFIFPEEEYIEPKIIPLDLNETLEKSFTNYINQNNLQKPLKSYYYFYLL